MTKPEHQPNDTPKVEYRTTPWSNDRLAGDDGSYWKRINPVVKRGRPVRASATTEEGERIQLLHIIILTTFRGPRPEGMWGLHRDDNKMNNRLDNLYWGTPLQNARDRIRNGHALMGSNHFCSKLTESDIPKIRRLLRSGLFCAEIAPMYGVSQQAIYSIHRGITWRHVPDPDTGEGDNVKNADWVVAIYRDEQIYAFIHKKCSLSGQFNDTGACTTRLSRIRRWKSFGWASQAARAYERNWPGVRCELVPYQEETLESICRELT